MIAARGDAGFTLVELLVTVAISALVMPVLGATTLIGYRTTDATVARLGETRDRQIVPSLFTSDVQSATVVDNSGTAGCPIGSDTLVVSLRWQETPVAGAAITRAAAWVTTVSAGMTLLERRECDDSGGAMALISSVTTAHGVVGTPLVNCRTAAGAPIACSTLSTNIARVDLIVEDAGGPFTVTAGRRAAL